MPKGTVACALLWRLHLVVGYIYISAHLFYCFCCCAYHYAFLCKCRVSLCRCVVVWVFVDYCNYKWQLPISSHYVNTTLFVLLFFIVLVSAPLFVVACNALNIYSKELLVWLHNVFRLVLVTEGGSLFRNFFAHNRSGLIV